jgi:1-acyl-sn-glycerol-3-phosphate acyltransferase
MKYFKLLAFTLILLLFFFFTIPLYPCLFLFENKTRKILNFLVKWTSWAWLKVLDIKVKTSKNFDESETFMIVSNHLSYLDALIISSVFPTSFVTSLEVKATSFLGHLTMLAGCLYVNRKDKSKIDMEIQGLRKALKENISVTFFPEATSTDGSHVIRFRKPLFEASISSGRRILPLTINYEEVSYQKISTHNRDSLFWYGEMTFFSHFMNLLDQSKIKVNLEVHEPFRPEIFPLFELAERSHHIISNSYNPVTSNLRQNEII